MSIRGIKSINKKPVHKSDRLVKDVNTNQNNNETSEKEMSK